MPRDVRLAIRRPRHLRLLRAGCQRHERKRADRRHNGQRESFGHVRFLLRLGRVPAGYYHAVYCSASSARAPRRMLSRP